MTTLRSELTPERQQVLSLHEQGYSARKIASVLKVSTQRVYQQLKKLEDAGLIPTERDAS